MEKGGLRDADDHSLYRLSVQSNSLTDLAPHRSSSRSRFSSNDGVYYFNAQQSPPQARPSQSSESTHRITSNTPASSCVAKHQEADGSGGFSWGTGGEWVGGIVPIPRAPSLLHDSSTEGQSQRLPGSDNASSSNPTDRSNITLTAFPRLSLDVPASMPRPQSTYSGIAAPAHPYALYQQTAFPEADGAVRPIPPTVIHVGFPGRTVNYHGQLAPTGEAMDVVGPDGFAEQLPPYSRYPDQPEAPPEKGRLTPTATVALPTSSMPSSVRSQPANLSPSSNIASPQAPTTPRPQDALIGMGQPLPHPGSPTITDIATLDGSGGSVAPSFVHEVRVFSEKRWNQKSRKEKWKTKVLCGVVPLWAAVLAGAVILLMAVVIGGVVGGLLSRERPRKPPQKSSSSKTMLDASFISAPTDAPPLPTGTFFFPLGTPREQQGSCLPGPDQINAWSCNVPPPPLQIEMGADGENDPVARIFPVDMSAFKSKTQWGPQPPRIDRLQKLAWVEDTKEPNRGPALHFQTRHDKLVILEQDDFMSSQFLRRRRAHKKGMYAGDYPPPPPPNDGSSLPPPGHDGPPYDGDHRGPLGPPPPGGPGGPPMHKFQVQPGDMPWYCFWNATFIQGFVYIKQPVPDAALQEFNMNRTAYSSATTTLTTSVTAGSPNALTSSETQTFTVASAILPAPPETITARVNSAVGATAAAATSTASQPTQFQRPKFNALEVDDDRDGPPGPPPGPPPFGDFSIPPRFPYIIKLEERHIVDPNAKPYCQQMKAMDDGTVIPFNDLNNQPQIVWLDEAPMKDGDVQFEAGILTDGHGDAGDEKKKRNLENVWNVVFRRRDGTKNSCHCQWVSPT